MHTDLSKNQPSSSHSTARTVPHALSLLGFALGLSIFFAPHALVFNSLGLFHAIVLVAILRPRGFSIQRLIVLVGCALVWPFVISWISVIPFMPLLDIHGYPVVYSLMWGALLAVVLESKKYLVNMLLVGVLSTLFVFDLHRYAEPWFPYFEPGEFHMAYRYIDPYENTELYYASRYGFAIAVWHLAMPWVLRNGPPTPFELQSNGRCTNCGYPLVGLDPKSNCPECGQ